MPNPFFPSGLQGAGWTSKGFATLVSSGSANTKGSWGEMSSAAPIECDGFIISMLPNDQSTYLLDIGVGASSSEQVILPNVCFNGPSRQFSVFVQFFVPLHIQKGARVSGRIQAIGGSRTVYTHIHFIAAGSLYASMSARRAVNYGANTSDSGGVTVTPDTSAYTYGAYSQLSASIEGFTSCLVCVTVDNPAAEFDDGNFGTDIAVGAAASERTLIADLPGRSTVDGDVINPMITWVPIGAKRGERLSSRGYSSVTSVDRIYDVSVIGFK